MKSLESLVKDIKASSAAIMAPNLAAQHLYCYDSYNMPPEWVELKNPFDNYTSTGNVHVFKTGKPALTNSFKQVFHGHYIESVLIVPIKNGANIIGTLEIIHSTKNRTFSKQDLQKAQDFAKQLEIKAR